VKIIVNGEAFEYHPDRYLMSEALAIEKTWGRRYAEFQHELAAGSAEAWAVLAWAVWRRNGREVDLQDIIDGKVDFDYTEMVRSVNEGYAEEAKAEEAKAAAEGPTSGASPLTDPDGTGTTPAATSGRSRPSSASARGKPGS
jgi:hypothetical protein